MWCALEGVIFTFSGVDLLSFTTDGSPFAITGYVNGSQVFTQSGTILSSGVFQTQASANPSAQLDRLVIAFTPGNTESNIDNINVTAVTAAAVPEPSEWAGMGMAGFALCGLMIKARRKAKSNSGNPETEG